jgi:hypothetical protein
VDAGVLQLDHDLREHARDSEHDPVGLSVATFEGPQDTFLAAMENNLFLG